jgi:DNA-directed RNA polymerase subunit F
MAQLVSANRQNWIIEVRETLAEFLRDGRSIVNAYRSGTYSIGETFERFEKLTLATQKVQLLLNPYEQDHSEIIAKMISITEHIRSELSSVFEGETISTEKTRMAEIDSIVPMAQRVLKSEWKRIKRGD